MKIFLKIWISVLFLIIVSGCQASKTQTLEDRSAFSGEKEAAAPYAEPQADAPQGEIPKVGEPTSQPPQS
ncbi:MAG: hypothetical protein UT55_C0010G0005 [Candidatus Peregrinibacteria bacterium GW2011_GWE2_39_6]|nr:MAG: hypothetical protein UT36_C0006G0006 [Candidatus Peregrinibacteria bacterium GW2011_GWF2_39_17]KKR26342.1 MAG: hypothetical protein UT55_C0010G0005 [Candidatus Peregrinibacteria bacterium GW2011_GWE2_39_6]HCW32829.1 hypothetical protein [Candidatus Peregrinibacteria bacterium]